LDIKQYIASGILELYVLEQLDPAQMREVETNALQHPEIRTEIDQIELTLEAFSIAAAPDISPEILDRLLTETANGKKQSPASQEHSKTPATGSSFAWIPWLLAAAALAGLLYAYAQLGNRTEELRDAQQQFELLQADCDQGQEVIRNVQQQLNALTNPATIGVILAGTDNAPNKQAMVFYNQATSRTLFKAVSLPPPPSGKQYQLWAIDAHGPKDLGVLALDLNGDVILEVTHLPAVVAFAITLEDEGGKPVPDLSTLQVYGDVATG
jgi:anti-sigma-K factor RskA